METALKAAGGGLQRPPEAAFYHCFVKAKVKASLSEVEQREGEERRATWVKKKKKRKKKKKKKILPLVGWGGDRVPRGAQGQQKKVQVFIGHHQYYSYPSLFFIPFAQKGLLCSSLLI